MIEYDIWNCSSSSDGVSVRVGSNNSISSSSSSSSSRSMITLGQLYVRGCYKMFKRI
jgi:hypothetical protein